MVEYEESIYNLIPKDQYVPQKPKRYRSQYPPNLAPTASTFGLKTTSKPVCANLSGKYNLEGGAHSHQAGGATFGAAKGTMRADQTNFRKKGTGQPVLVNKKEGKNRRFSSFHSLSHPFESLCLNQRLQNDEKVVVQKNISVLGFSLAFLFKTEIALKSYLI